MRKHILLIDDDKDEMMLLCEALTEAGLDHRCTWARGVDHAVQILEYLEPDVIMIDYNMPGVNGIQGIGRIRQIAKLVHIPIVLYSNSIDDIKKEAMRLGAVACIKKPSTSKDFAEMVAAVDQLSQHVFNQ